MWTDGWFLSGVMDGLATRLRDNNRDNTYVYLFTHKGVASISEISGGREEKFYGTCHADDLFYLFPLYKTWTHFNNAIPSEEDKRLIKIMTKLWVNFANSE
jgi:carboxylesterase type B